MRIKYVETLGQTVADRLTRSDQVKAHCGRECRMCSTQPGNCTKKNIVYSIECRECIKEGRESKYFGETARTGWERSREHFALLENYPDKSAL